MARTSHAGPLAGLVLGTLLVLGAPPPPAQADEPVIGKRHPPLRLPTIDGKQTIDPAAPSGTWTLLVQFASW